MTPERHRHIGELFHAALELEADARASFLERECAQDAELRREVNAVEAPASLERVLTAQFRERRDRARRPRLWWMPPLALAATIALATWMIRGAHTGDPIVIERTPVRADAGPFLALRPMERMSLEPGTTTVVTTEFPRALLSDR